MGRKVRPEGGSRAFGGGGNPGLTKVPGWGQPSAPRELTEGQGLGRLVSLGKGLKVGHAGP